MKQWHYSEFDQVKGPISQAELTQLFESGALSPHTLVWTEGQGDWQAASTIEGLIPITVSNLLNHNAPAPIPEIISDDNFEPSGEQIRPWIRYWARLVDFLLFSLCVGVIIGIIDITLLDNIHDTVLGIILLLAYIPVEPLLLMSWGTTPGKFLLNIRLRNENGSKLSYTEALTRCLKVTISGQGIGIPLISLITHIMAYQRLTNQGITTWDESGNYAVDHKEVSIWRAILVVLFFVGFILLIASES